jgi:phosphoribosylaminoimidazole-succinocarboxamide synthase
MRRVSARVVVTVVAVLVAGSMWAAAPAGAGVSATNKKFCAAVADFGEQIGDPSSDREEAEEIASSFRKAAKYAPSKVKKAMKKVASLYGRIADGDSPVEVFATGGTGFVRAASTFGTYYASQCFDVDITLPDQE